MARPKASRLKAHRSYTVEELAETLGKTEQTIRRWIKDGLPALIDRRPALVLGCDAKDYLTQRTKSKRQPLGTGELFCLSCKEPTQPAFDVAEYAPLSDSHGRISAFCTRCECPCPRIIRGSDIHA